MLDLFDKGLMALHTFNQFATGGLLIIYVGLLVKNAILKMTGNLV